MHWFRQAGREPEHKGPPRSLVRALPLLVVALTAAGSPAAHAQELPGGFRDEFLLQFESSMGKFIALARAMPEEKFDWRPGEGVMPVAQVYAHVARYNYLYPATNLGIAAPADIQLDALEQVAAKSDVIELLVRSRDHIRQLSGEMSDAELTQITALYGRDVQQWSVLLQLLAHMNEHLGQSIAYARMNGIVPPWSQ